MFEFIWWWLWLALPLPFFIYRFVKPVPREAAIELPQLPKKIGEQQSTNRLYLLLLSLCWLGVIGAATRPVWYGDPITLQPKHRDMILTVDLSGSMRLEDMVLADGSKVNRLDVVKSVVGDFIEKRQGDRMGLVVFADHGYLQTPLTLDRNTIAKQLDRTVVGLIGLKTAIGEGLGVATKTFIESKAEQKVIILLTDGSNTSGVIDPLEAATLAKEHGVTIYTIGIGADEMYQRSLFGTRIVNPSQELDEKTLMKIAKMTNGQYFRARDPRELNKIYSVIDELEPISNVEQIWRPQDELFRFPLGVALFLSMLIAILRRHY